MAAQLGRGCRVGRRPAPVRWGMYFALSSRPAGLTDVKGSEMRRAAAPRGALPPSQGPMTLMRSLLDDVDILRSVFDSLAVGVVVCDHRGQLVCFNPEAQRILGVELQEVGT